jgi:hypothetical protein
MSQLKKNNFKLVETGVLEKYLLLINYLRKEFVDTVFFLSFLSYYIHHCFICRPSDSTVPTNAKIEPRTVATSALAVRRCNHWTISHPL